MPNMPSSTTPAPDLPWIRYGRVSRVGARAGAGYISPDLQDAETSALAARNGVATFPDLFLDENYSGGNTDRPRFQEALALIESGKAAGLIVKTLDRFSRDVEDALGLMRQLAGWGSPTIICGDGDVPTSARDPLRFVAIMRLAVAEDERQRRGKALADIVHNAVVVKGIHLAAPFGYAKLGRGEGLVPDPQEAPVVALMFAKRAEGYSWGKIAEAANATGIHPRPRKRNGVVAQATWTAQSCSQLTQSRVYLGVAHNGGHETVGAHEALISRDLWERVGERRGAQPKRGTDGHLLSGGLVRCSGCGRALIAVPTDGRLYYRCRHKACPVRVSVAAGALEEWVVAEFKRVAFGQEWRAETDDAPVRAAEAQHAAALEDYAQVLANRPRHEAARAVW